MGKNPPANSGDVGSTTGLEGPQRLEEGNGNLLQYSCLENLKDRRAWWATVCGITKSRTLLCDWTHTHYIITSRPGKRCGRIDIILSYSKCGLHSAALASLKGLELPFHNLCLSKILQQDPHIKVWWEGSTEETSEGGQFSHSLDGIRHCEWPTHQPFSNPSVLPAFLPITTLKQPATSLPLSS